jgi:hypothetical protein
MLRNVTAFELCAKAGNDNKTIRSVAAVFIGKILQENVTSESHTETPPVFGRRIINRFLAGHGNVVWVG